MRHTAKPNSKPARDAAWREHFDLTERQCEILVALCCAQLLGYDGATSAELRELGIVATSRLGMGHLERLGLIRTVGFVAGNVRVWQTTNRGFKRFGITPPSLIPIVIKTAEDRAELMLQRQEKRRQKARERQMRERMKVSA